MPKVKKVNKNTKVEIEWLEPLSDKGCKSVILAKKIQSYDKGISVGATVLVLWGSRRYKAIIRNLGNERNGKHIT